MGAAVNPCRPDTDPEKCGLQCRGRGNPRCGVWSDEDPAPTDVITGEVYEGPGSGSDDYDVVDYKFGSEDDVDTELDCKLLYNFSLDQTLGASFASLGTPTRGGVLVVSSIDEGSFLSFTQDGQQGLRCGDVIWAVNDRRGTSAKLLKLLKQAKKGGGHVAVSALRRPTVFEVELLRTNQEKMGLIVASVGESNVDLVVTHIFKDGAVPAWNRKYWTKQVKLKDKVAAVNGATKSPASMIDDLQESWTSRGTVKFTIRLDAAKEVQQKLDLPRDASP